MEESYETFEEELGSPRADPPPQKPVRQIRRPEMYATRKIREEVAPVQLRAEPKTLPREPTSSRTMSLQKTLSVQGLTQTETPWENVTLNRCLFVAITILVLTSGFQKVHETLRGQGPVEEQEEFGLRTRRLGTLRQRGHPPEPETSLWEVMFWWLPDLDDEDDEEEDDDDDGVVKKGKSKKGATRAPSSLRNKPLPDKKLLKSSKSRKLTDRKAKKAKDEEVKENKDTEEATEDEGEGDDTISKKKKKSVEKKEKTQKG
ncbi:ubiquitin carboxyl-terminal hydrolase 36 isoform X2 [Parambassis ranga]|nr:ubiquitin carboxyl-terminal hydrolase 36-like isoform X2 [Parambassis ranga]